MRSYPFINELFKNVLQKSKAIEGRFFVSSKSGLEINSDTLGQVLTDTLTEVHTKKYPLVLMLPPRSTGKFTDKNGEWKKMIFDLFFLKTTYYSSNNEVSDMNPNTQTSMHTILHDWHDMERSATNFIRVLDTIQKSKNLINTAFRLPHEPKTIDPISMVGSDRASGVRLRFTGDVFIGCELEDYNEADINSIIIPVADSHPEHKL